jgi:hypothetical protein
MKEGGGGVEGSKEVAILAKMKPHNSEGGEITCFKR